MLTQTHMLVGMALFGRSVEKASLRVSVAAAGAVLPDLSLFIMWGQARMRDVPEQEIWSELYFSPVWQSAGAVTNSIPLYFLLALCGAALGLWCHRQNHRVAEMVSVLISVASLAALVHTLCDMPLHHDDGHPHFWPFSTWIFSSPVSYWDKRHFAGYWMPVEALLGFGCVALLWRRFSSRIFRSALVLFAMSFVAPALYWSSSL